jgi:hypothetical protein
MYRKVGCSKAVPTVSGHILEGTGEATRGSDNKFKFDSVIRVLMTFVFRDMEPRHWVNGARRFETVQRSHLEGSLVLFGRTTFQNETCTMSGKVGHQLQRHAAPYYRITESSTAPRRKPPHTQSVCTWLRQSAALFVGANTSVDDLSNRPCDNLKTGVM